MVPLRLKAIIGVPVPSRYCIVHKADIPKPRVRAVASYVRFHSQDNRLKGDPPPPGVGSRALEANYRVWRIGMLSRALSLAAVAPPHRPRTGEPRRRPQAHALRDPPPD